MKDRQLNVKAFPLALDEKLSLRSLAKRDNKGW